MMIPTGSASVYRTCLGHQRATGFDLRPYVDHPEERSLASQIALGGADTFRDKNHKFCFRTLAEPEILFGKNEARLEPWAVLRE